MTLGISVSPLGSAVSWVRELDMFTGWLGVGFFDMSMV